MSGSQFMLCVAVLQLSTSVLHLLKAGVPGWIVYPIAVLVSVASVAWASGLWEAAGEAS